MKRLLKIDTVYKSIALLSKYEPVSKRFWLHLRRRAFAPMLLKRGPELFFERRKRGKSASITFFSSVNIADRSRQTLNLSMADHRRYYISNALFYESQKRESLKMIERERSAIATEVAISFASKKVELAKKRFYRYENGVFDFSKRKSPKRSPSPPKESMSYLPPNGSLSNKETVPTLYFENINHASVLKPVQMHFASPFSSKESTLGAKESLKERSREIFKTEKRDIHIESKEVRREKIKEIERISEKVYTLVMKKWEQERRRRGVLYE